MMESKTDSHSASSDDASYPVRKILAAKSLLEEESKIRSRAMHETVNAVERLMQVLRQRDARQIEVEKQLKAEKLENRMLNDLLMEQASRCVDAENAQKVLQDKLRDATGLLYSSVEQAKLQARQVKEWKAKEAAAVAEINRRAVQQQELREAVARLEAKAAESKVLGGEAVALQTKIDKLQEELRLAKKALLEEKAHRMRLEGALEDHQQETMGRFAAITDSNSSEKGSLQRKLDQQMVEILNLKTEMTKKDGELFESKRELENQTIKASRLEEELFMTREEANQAKQQLDEFEGETAEQARLVMEQHSEKVKELHALRTELDQFRLKEAETQKEIIRLKEEVLEKANLSLKYAQLEAKLQKQEEKNSEMERELARLKSKSDEDQSNSRALAVGGAVMGAASIGAAASIAASSTDELEEKQAEWLEKEIKLKKEISSLKDGLEKKTQDEKELVEQIAVLHESCESMRDEILKLKGQMQSTSNTVLSPKRGAREMQILVEELIGLRSACVHQHEQAQRLKRQLLRLKDVQQVSLYKSGSLEDLELKLKKMQESEVELKKEAVTVRDEAKRINLATHKMLTSLISIKNKYTVNPSPASKLEPTKQAQQLMDLPKHKQLDFDNNDEEEDGGVIDEASIRDRTSSVSHVLKSVAHSKQETVDEGDESAEEEEDEEEEQDASGKKKTSSEDDDDETVETGNVVEIVFRGYITKSPPSTSRWSRWRRRFFLLTSAGKLYYMKTPTSRVVKGIIDINTARVFGPEDSVDAKANKFFVQTTQRTYELCAPTRSMMHKWINVLQKFHKEKEVARHLKEGGGGEEPSETATFYETLGVDVDASQEEVHRAYELASSKFHPSVNPNPDSRLFDAVSKAYSVLSSPSLRADYDLSLDVKALFVAGFVALLHPNNPQFYNKQSGPKSSRRPRKQFFYSDDKFQKLFWTSDKGDGGNQEKSTDSTTVPNINWSDVVLIQNGEDSVESALFNLPTDRCYCSFALITKQPGPLVSVEVDGRQERDKIVHALRIITNTKNIVDE